MGYLGDERVVPMEELDEYYQGTEPLEVLRRSFFGYDDVYSASKQKAPFNPNRDYFYLNGYGNLVSTDERDYSDFLDEEFVEEIISNASNLELSNGAQKILDKYEDQEKE